MSGSLHLWAQSVNDTKMKQVCMPCRTRSGSAVDAVSRVAIQAHRPALARRHQATRRVLGDVAPPGERTGAWLGPVRLLPVSCWDSLEQS